jgi:hypothetical protein
MIGNDIWRFGKKIGWIEGDYVRDRDGNRLGYFQDHFIFNADGDKVAYIEDGYLISQDPREEFRMALNHVAKEVEGGILSDIARCAIYVLLVD